MEPFEEGKCRAGHAVAQPRPVFRVQLGVTNVEAAGRYADTVQVTAMGDVMGQVILQGKFTAQAFKAMRPAQHINALKSVFYDGQTPRPFFVRCKAEYKAKFTSFTVTHFKWADEEDGVEVAN